MRFARAAGILAQTLPVVALSESVAEKDFISLLPPKTVFRKSASKNVSTTTTKERRLGLALKNSISPKKECMPDSDVVDIGILSCGTNEYCVESAGSSLGGYCMSSDGYANHRYLQSTSDFYPQPTVCDAQHYNYASYDCECDGFDVAQNIGSFTCTLYEFECKRENLCGPNTVTQTLYSGGSARADYCYDFNNPNEKHLCYSIDTETTCTILVDGVQCSSCEIQDKVVNPDNGFVGYGCYEFDCTNIPEVGISGNNCMGDYVLDALSNYFQITPAPSFAPTMTMIPSQSPSDSTKPSVKPSQMPSMSPTDQPSSNPSESPTIRPSSTPSLTPTMKPSSTPSMSPTDIPSSEPSMSPTDTPSSEPTRFPSTSPSSLPTRMPSSSPSAAPTPVASASPTAVASDPPSDEPSQSPSIATPMPTSRPTFEKWYEGKYEEPPQGDSTSSAREILSLPFCIISTIILVSQLW